jgi:hypothetical protein
MHLEPSAAVVGTVVQGVSFFPRGGSAHVIRCLTGALQDIGWSARIVAGSVGAAGQPGHAGTFYRGLAVYAADFTPALDAWRSGGDPLAQPVPMHSSYEDKTGAPDRFFGDVAPAVAARQADAWRRILVASGSAPPDILHLHHLTPLHDAARQLWPTVPTVTHLHGTELLMLEEIEHWTKPWPHAAYWADRLRATAGASDRVIVASSHVAQTRDDLAQAGTRSGDGRPERSRHRPLPSAPAEHPGKNRNTSADGGVAVVDGCWPLASRDG